MICGLSSAIRLRSPWRKEAGDESTRLVDQSCASRGDGRAAVGLACGARRHPAHRSRLAARRGRRAGSRWPPSCCWFSIATSRAISAAAARRQLIGLRLAALGLLAWILIEPTLVRTVKRRLDRQVAVLWDQSASMDLTDAGRAEVAARNRPGGRRAIRHSETTRRTRPASASCTSPAARKTTMPRPPAAGTRPPTSPPRSTPCSNRSRRTNSRARCF